jgi:hypothetical protein
VALSLPRGSGCGAWCVGVVSGRDAGGVQLGALTEVHTESVRTEGVRAFRVCEAPGVVPKGLGRDLDVDVARDW